MQVFEQRTQEQIKHWTDLFFQESKKAGYVAVTDFRFQYFYGLNDVQKVINTTAGRKKQFISINAFDVNWRKKSFSRETKALKQIRNIAIDIDQYKLGLTISETLDEIQLMIIKDRIPEPNLILTSRGIQLFYSIDRGASPEMAWLAGYITDQLIGKLEHIGADSNAKDMSRVMRVPGSINERNNAVVKSDIWNDTAYSLQELQGYCKPLENFRDRKRTRHNVVSLPSKSLVQFYKTNYARKNDLHKLIELRQGDLTGMRNVFLYMYTFHQSLILSTQADVLNSMKAIFKNIYSTRDRPMTKREFETIVKSAYKDAEQFFNHFINNGYRIIYKEGDGVKKPYKTSNVIRKLNITPDEQRALKSLHNPEIEKEKHTKYMRQKRIKDGTHQTNRQEYDSKRKQRKQDLQSQVKALKQQGFSNIQTAQELAISKAYVGKLVKELVEQSESEVDKQERPDKPEYEKSKYQETVTLIAYELYEAGKTYNEIAAMTKVTPDYIGEIIRGKPG